jgi:organic radical activating enzyme
MEGVGESMNKLTLSICPVCYRSIPAVIEAERGVIMTKNCSEHGVFTSVVERDPQWFNYCQALNCKGIYDGLLIDVTKKCQLQCQYCYHKNEGEHIPVSQIIEDAKKLRDCKLFILTGGEPTLHPDLSKIITGLKEYGDVSLLTNGIKLCNEKYFKEIIPLLEKDGGVNVGLSFHKESEGKDFEFLGLCRKHKKKIATGFFVIDDIQQIDEALNIAREYRDVMMVMRIKAASNLGDERNADNKIFVSDMLNYLSSRGNTQIITGTNENGYTYNNKVSIANVMHEGIQLMLISWYDVNNIDLYDIDCAPYYKAQDGNVYDMVNACIINEGIEKKKGINVRKAFYCDLQKCGELWKEMVFSEKGIKSDSGIWINQMTNFLKNANNHFEVGEINGQIVGFVTGTIGDIDAVTGENIVWGLQFYIQPDFRKTGLAQAMHKSYKKYAQRNRVKKVVRRTTNQHGYELIKRNGYSNVGMIVEEVLCP